MKLHVAAMTQDLREMIGGARNLTELHQALIAVEDKLCCAEAVDDGASDTPLCVRVDELIDVTSLPTFGGEEPRDTMGIWSWDETHLLVGEGSWSECTIVPRANA